MTQRQREAEDLMKVEGNPIVVAQRMGITARAVQYLLRRAGKAYPVGRPSKKPRGMRISLIAARAA